MKIDDSNLTISILTTGNAYKFNISSDDRWQNNLELIVEFFNHNFEKVLLGEYCCKIDTFKQRQYIYFDFYEDFEDDYVNHGQFTGLYIK